MCDAASRYQYCSNLLFVSPPEISYDLMALYKSVCYYYYYYYYYKGAEYSVDCVCLSVRELISRNTRSIFTRFLCVLPVAWLGPVAVLRYVMYFRFYG